MWGLAWQNTRCEMRLTGHGPVWSPLLFNQWNGEEDWEDAGLQYGHSSSHP